MRFRWDKKYLYWGVNGILCDCGQHCFLPDSVEDFRNQGIFWDHTESHQAGLYGLLFAYLMNPLVKTFERPILVQWGETRFTGKTAASREASPAVLRFCWRWCWCF